jgi:D-alanyl-D-alanine carboxypeptidase
VNKDGQAELKAQYRANQLMIPASTQKVSTGYLAYVNSCYPVYSKTDSNTYLNRHKSPSTHSKSINALLHYSHNERAEQALNSCGGIGNLKNFYINNDFGIQTAEYNPVDGSGLDTDNLVTPSTQIKILEKIYRSGNYTAFKKLLAQPGSYGTLKSRFSGYTGKIFAKTGTMPSTGVKSLMGFFETSKGVLLFSVIVNKASGKTGAAFSEIENFVTEVVKKL